MSIQITKTTIRSQITENYQNYAVEHTMETSGGLTRKQTKELIEQVESDVVMTKEHVKFMQTWRNDLTKYENLVLDLRKGLRDKKEEIAIRVFMEDKSTDREFKEFPCSPDVGQEYHTPDWLTKAYNLSNLPF